MLNVNIDIKVHDIKHTCTCVQIYFTILMLLALLVKYELEYKDMFMVCQIKETSFITNLMFHRTLITCTSVDSRVPLV